jgi:hypothetical protein
MMQAGVDNALDQWLERCAGLADAAEAAQELCRALGEERATQLEALILFARTCEKFALHHAAAELRCQILQRQREVVDDPRLLGFINQVESVLDPAAKVVFEDAAGFLAACVQRLFAQLAGCGLKDENARLWLRGRLPEPDLLALIDRLRWVEPPFASAPAVRVLEATRRARPPDREPKAAQPWKVALVIASTVASLILGYFAPSIMAAVFEWRRDGPRMVDEWVFVAAGLWWPGMLGLTWLYARHRSRVFRTYTFIRPGIVVARNGCLFGDITPFRQDNFYHIFQFVWVFLAVIALYSFVKFNHIENDAKHLFDKGGVTEELASYRAAIWQDFGDFATLYSDKLWVLAALIAGLLVVLSQYDIQRRRNRSGVDIYWWDKRIDDPFWWVRMGMIFIDIVIAFYLIAKVAVMSLIIYSLLTTKGIDRNIRLLDPLALGGQETLFHICMTVLLIVTLFGFFLMASLYLHRNMAAYRWRDRLSLLVYVVVGAFFLFGPVRAIYDNIEQRKSAAIERVMPALETAMQNPEAIGAANQYISFIQSVEGVPSEMLNVALLLSPVSLLVAQTLVLLWQAVVRGRRVSLTERLLR